MHRLWPSFYLEHVDPSPSCLLGALFYHLYATISFNVFATHLFLSQYIMYMAMFWSNIRNRIKISHVTGAVSWQQKKNIGTWQRTFLPKVQIHSFCWLQIMKHNTFLIPFRGFMLLFPFGIPLIFSLTWTFFSTSIFPPSYPYCNKRSYQRCDWFESERTCESKNTCHLYRSDLRSSIQMSSRDGAICRRVIDFRSVRDISNIFLQK